MASGNNDDSPPTIRVAGPHVADEMFESLVAQLTGEKPSGDIPDEQKIKLTFQRLESAASAAGALLTGRVDISLTFGPVSDRDISQGRARWNELDVQHHVVGVRAVAIVVHPRNPVETLSIEQIQAIFSGRIEQWSIVGGHSGGGAIRRYGLAPTDPLTSLFQEKVLSVGSRSRMAMLVRKQDSDEALTALRSDPTAIAYVDAVSAMAAGDAIRIVAIGEGEKAVSPNVQSLKDGTYSLSAPLVMYVSPQASVATQRLVQHILTGGGDATLRRFGLMPALREVPTDVMAAFKGLYGEQIQRVQGTVESDDDIDLAHQMIQSARTMPQDAGLLTAMCEAAYDLAARAAKVERSGYPGRAYATAFEAIRVLSKRMPEARFDCAIKHAALYEQAFEASQSRLDGEHLVESLITASNHGTDMRLHEQALDTWRRARIIADKIHSPKLSVIEARLPAFESRATSVHEANMLVKTLMNDPDDGLARHKMLMLQLIELDNPEEAARFLDAAPNETIKTNVPLAQEPLERLSADAALNLAEWYTALTDRAGVGGAERMAARARACYTRFFELHEERDDSKAIRAGMGIRRVGGQIPVLSKPKKQTRGKRKRQAINAVLQSNEHMTNLKLAEFIAANPGLTRLTRREIGNYRHVTDLSPLTRLTKLTTLELRDLSSVTNIAPLAELPNLTSLTLTELKAEDITPLSRLFRLTSLTMFNAKQFTDITPLSHLTNLKSLNLAGCQSVKNLTPLQRLDRTLVTLELNGCTGIESFEPLFDFRQLRKLDLHQSSATAKDIEQLQQQLINTKVLGP